MCGVKSKETEGGGGGVKNDRTALQLAKFTISLRATVQKRQPIPHFLSIQVITEDSL